MLRERAAAGSLTVALAPLRRRAECNKAVDRGWGASYQAAGDGLVKLYAPAAAAFGPGKVLIVGGEGPAGNARDEYAVIDAASGAVSTFSSGDLGPRRGASVVFDPVDRSAYVFGGHDADTSVLRITGPETIQPGDGCVARVWQLSAIVNQEAEGWMEECMEQEELCSFSYGGSSAPLTGHLYRGAGFYFGGDEFGDASYEAARRQRAEESTASRISRGEPVGPSEPYSGVGYQDVQLEGYAIASFDAIHTSEALTFTTPSGGTVQVYTDLAESDHAQDVMDYLSHDAEGETLARDLARWTGTRTCPSRPTRPPPGPG